MAHPKCCRRLLISFMAFLSILCLNIRNGPEFRRLFFIIMPENPTKKLKLRVKKSLSGLGLFAMEPIKKGSFIIEYCGKQISKDEEERRTSCRYLFEINSRKTIDGSARSNLARYINHSCRPNAEVEIKKGRVLIYAKKDITIGEEINYDYGREYWNEYIKPIGCRCKKCSNKKASK